MPEGRGRSQSPRQSPPPRSRSRSQSPVRGRRSQSPERERVSPSPEPRDQEGLGGGYTRQTWSLPPARASLPPLQDRSASAPARVSLDMVANEVKEALIGNPDPLIRTFKARSVTPDFSQSLDFSQSQEFELGPDLSTLEAMKTLTTYEGMKSFLSRAGSVLLGAAYAGGEGAMVILGLAIEKGGVAFSIVAEYLSDHLAALDGWAQTAADIFTMDISTRAEFTAVAARWRDHLGTLPETGTAVRLAVRLVKAYGWTVLSRVGSIGSIVFGHLFSLLYKVLYYLLTAPGSIDYAATASFIIEIASLCLEYITGGLIAVGPGQNTIAQLIIFLMTVLALGDALKPKLGSANDQAIELLRKLLEYLEKKGVNVVDFINTSVIPLLQSVHAYSEPLTELFQRARKIIFEVGVHTITFSQALAHVSAKLVINLPKYAEKLTEILRMLEVRGRGGGGAAPALPPPPAAAAPFGAVAAVPPAVAAAPKADEGGATPMEEDGGGGFGDGHRGAGRIRKSRKSSRNKGKKSKSGGAKVKTAKRRTPYKKSKGKKAKKSKKN